MTPNENEVLGQELKTKDETATANVNKNLPVTGGDGDGDDDNGGNKPRIYQTNYNSSNAGIVALGIYLILFALLSFYAMKVLMTAEEPVIEKTKVGNEEKKNYVCGNDTRPVPDEVKQITAIVETNNAAANTDNTNSANTNSTNANSTNTETNAATPNTNANASASPTKSVSPATNASPKKTEANAADNSNKTKEQTTNIKIEYPQIGVPQLLCLKSRVFGSSGNTGGGRILPADGYLFFVVLFAGMLGGLMRGIASFARHLGVGDFSFKWTWFYIMLPFTGAIISLAIYLILRGGFYNGTVGKGLALNVFAFAALAILTGLFSENALEKLRKVAVTLLDDVPAKVATNKSEVKKKGEE